MRGKLFLIWILSACVLCLCGCTRVIDSPADEIKLYRWEAKLDNGNKATLSFDDGKAEFSAVSEDFSLELSGVVILTDDAFIICDENDDMHYPFSYTLYGDRVELSSNGSVISLKKVDDP